VIERSRKKSFFSLMWMKFDSKILKGLSGDFPLKKNLLLGKKKGWRPKPKGDSISNFRQQHSDLFSRS